VRVGHAGGNAFRKFGRHELALNIRFREPLDRVPGVAAALGTR
jgi:hypothetical protein